MKKITIDATCIVPGSKINGINRTTEGLINQIDSIKDLDLEISLFTQKLRGERLKKFRFKKYHLPLPKWKFFSFITKNFPLIESICQADLYHIPHNHASYYKLDKCIVTIHDAMFLTYPEKHLGHEKMVKDITTFAKKCKAIITCSEHSKKDICKYMSIPETKVHVCYWGIDHKLFTPSKNKNIDFEYVFKKFDIKNEFFLSNSCDIGRKNTPLLVDAFLEYLKTSNEKKYDLVLVWRNPTKEVIDKVNNSTFKDKIHFLSYISDNDLVKLYQTTKATFMPSLYEGFGLPVLEAIACGSPIITTRLSSLPEVGGDAAIYVEPTKDELVKVMSEIEQNKIDLPYHIEKGIKHASNFTWKNCANKTLEVYKKCLV